VIYIRLFWVFFQTGLFTIGGGYASLPMIQQEVLERYNWMTISEFADMVALSQVIPGPIALNAATFVGMHVAGYGGVIATTLGLVTPAFVLMLTLAYLYKKYSQLERIQGVLNGLRPTSVALISTAGVAIIISTIWRNEFSLSIGAIDVTALIIFLLSIIAMKFFKVKTFYVILGAGLAGIIITLI
jgi:chromate transporter